VLLKPIIELVGVSKSFGKKLVLNDVSVNLLRNHRYCFIGPNGAGKTTLLSLMSSLLYPDKGFVRVWGYDTQTQGILVRQKISFVFQECLLDDDLSVDDNLSVHALLYSLGSQRKLRQVWVKRLLGLEKEGMTLARNLSGGLRKRLELARALLHQPDVLFLDEPTIGLDPVAKKELWSYLSTLRNTTLVFSTNDVQEVLCLRPTTFLVGAGGVRQLPRRSLTKNSLLRILERVILP
jgi:ABC-2 type transport system ATP-binding protein